MEEDQGSLEIFLKWAAELGISDLTTAINHQSQNPNTHSCLGHSLSVSHFPLAGGRGLGAARDLRKGELILRVPKSALMTRDSLLSRDHELSVAVNRYPSLSSTQILTVCLLHEMGKGKSSWWHPYSMHLPRSYDTLPTFGEFEKHALQVDDATWATERAILKAESEWKEATELMRGLKLRPQLSAFRAWLWASATISSRTMHISWDEAGCLCPVGDLFNYAAPGEEPFGFEDVDSWRHASSLQGNPSWYGDNTDGMDPEQFDAHLQRLTDGVFEEDVAAYCFYARKNYKKGEQVLLSYGTYTNLELLEHYGFFLNENPNDKVFIPLEPDTYISSSWPKDSLYIHQNGKPSFALLSALRLWATPSNRRRSIGHLVYSGYPLSAENETIVMKWIAKKCCIILKNLPTSLEEDNLLLCAIDKVQDLDIPTKLRNMLSAFGDEVSSFLEANGLQNGESGDGIVLSRRSKRAMERWKLAIQWRLRYKRILVDCISYCNEIVSSLSCPNVSITGTEKCII